MDRFAYWADFINQNNIKSVTEIGVWRGEFAEALLSSCPGIEQYFLVDPWRELSDWNKPFNVSQAEFDKIFAEVEARIEPYNDKVSILRGRTTEVDLPKVDFTYIDGDHTLRGITIDMVCAWPQTTWLGGDDFGGTWAHGTKYEPSLVKPFAAYFAEAHDAPFIVQGNQFLMGGEGSYECQVAYDVLSDTTKRRKWLP